MKAFFTGEVAEWSKAHAWKVCVRQKRTKGSNPFLSASKPNLNTEKSISYQKPNPFAL